MPHLPVPVMLEESMPRSALLPVLLLFTLASLCIAGGHPFGAVAVDREGIAYLLDSRTGEVKRGVERRSVVPPRDSGVQATDIAVVADRIWITTQSVSDMVPRLEGYDLNGRPIATVELAPRFFPQRIQPVADGLAVLGSTAEHGIFIDFIVNGGEIQSEQRIYTSLPCADLGIADMAVVDDGIWVTSLERCDGGYVLQKYAMDGTILAEVRRNVAVMTDAPNAPPLLGIFATQDYVGVVLNQRATENGKPIALWSQDGEYLKSVHLPVHTLGFIQVVASPITKNALTVVDLESRQFQTFQMRDLKEVQ